NANLGLFGSRKLIDLRIPSGKPGLDGAKALESYAVNPNPDNVTLITLPRLDRATLNSAWFAALSQTGATVAVQPIERETLPRWIAARLAGDAARTIRILTALEAEGEAVTLAVWQMTEDLRAIAGVHAAQKRGVPIAAAVRNTRVWGRRQAALEKAVRRIPPARIGAMV